MLLHLYIIGSEHDAERGVTLGKWYLHRACISGARNVRPRAGLGPADLWMCGLLIMTRMCQAQTSKPRLA